MDETTLTLTTMQKHERTKRVRTMRHGTKRPSMHPKRINRCWPVPSGPQL